MHVDFIPPRLRSMRLFSRSHTNNDDDYTPVLPRLQSKKLFSRSRINDCFDESEQAGLNELLLNAESDLVLPCDLLTLSDMLSNERDDLQRHVECSKSLAAPIRKLPPEILAEIFVHYATENEISRRRVYIPGLRLAGVSGHWRSVALTTPALWTSIRIAPVRPHHHADHMTLLHDILSRSLHRPLHICIVFDYDRENPNGSFHPAILLLFEHVARWKTFRVIDHGCAAHRYSVVNALSPIQGRLTGLSAFECFDNREFSSLFEGATNLRSLTLSRFTSSGSTIPWGQITEFTASTPVSQIIPMLTRMDKLNTLNLSYPGAYEKCHQYSVHHNLCNFHIMVDGDYTQGLALSALLNELTLPNLRSLRISITDKPYYTKLRFAEAPLYTGLPFAVSLIERSAPPLLHLSLFRVDFSTEQMFRLLQSVPTLKELMLTEPLRSQSPTLTTDFFQQLHVRHQSLVPKLSLLEINANTLSVDLEEEFVKVLKCRYRESDTRKELGRIVSAKLTVQKGALDNQTVKSLMELRKLGLAVCAVDESGEITLEESAFDLKDSL